MAMKTKIRISFKSKNQTPYLMIIKEYYKDDKILGADVLYQEDENESEVMFDEELILAKEFRVIRK